MRKTLKTNLLFLAILFALLATNFQSVFALEDGGFVKREKDIVFNKSYEIFIGNGGVFLDNSRHIGKLVVKAREPVNRQTLWIPPPTTDLGRPRYCLGNAAASIAEDKHSV